MSSRSSTYEAQRVRFVPLRRLSTTLPHAESEPPNRAPIADREVDGDRAHCLSGGVPLAISNVARQGPPDQRVGVSVAHLVLRF
jgi:hypothetical protein